MPKMIVTCTKGSTTCCCPFGEDPAFKPPVTRAWGSPCAPWGRLAAALSTDFGPAILAIAECCGENLNMVLCGLIGPNSTRTLVDWQAIRQAGVSFGH